MSDRMRKQNCCEMVIHVPRMDDGKLRSAVTDKYKLQFTFYSNNCYKKENKY